MDVVTTLNRHVGPAVLAGWEADWDTDAAAARLHLQAEAWKDSP